MPLRRRHLDAHDLVLEDAAIASAAWARRWLSTANASCSARVMPYCSATRSAVSPSEMVQSAGIRGLTKRQPTVVSAIGGGVRSHGLPDLSITYGARVMLSTPPAMNSVALAGPDGVRRARDGLEAGAAEPVHRLSRHLDR